MAGLGKAAAMSPVRKKQMLLLAGLVGTIAIIALAIGMMGGPTKRPAVDPAKPENATRKAFGAQGEQINKQDIWRTEESAKVLNLQTEVAELKKMIEQKSRDDRKKEEDDKRKAELDAAKARESAKDLPVAPPPPPPPPRAGGAAAAGQLGMPPGGDVPMGEPKERVRGIIKMDITRDGASAAAVKTAATAAAGRPPAGQAAGGDAVVVGGKSAETYLPAGSFMRGLTLSGLDAPTGGQVQQNPHPIIFRVTDFANLPNRFRSDFKECFVTANGYGDISSERAYIRLDRMSCIFEDGGALDVAIKGFVAGEDGKAGMRGRLVSKQGQVLANALLAGVASGIGHGITQSATTTSTSPLGSTSSVKEGQEFKAGIGQGVGKALDKLTNYYIQLAEKMFPVVEIDAGREADIVITKGISLERR